MRRSRVFFGFATALLLSIPTYASSLEQEASETVVNANTNRIHKEDVSSILQNLPTGIKSLDVSGHGLKSDEMGPVLEVIAKNSDTLEVLDLEYNNIGPAGAAALAGALAGNSTLKDLNLKNNALEDAGVEALAKFLCNNSSLTALNLGLNYIHLPGAEALKKALADNKTLTMLDLNLNDSAVLEETLKETLKAKPTLTVKYDSQTN